MEKAITYIGGYSPIVLLILTVVIFYVEKRPQTMLIYLIGFVLNVVLNIILKYIIQQPRPFRNEAEERMFNAAKSRGKLFEFNVYGMPSGHAQMAAFSLTFMILYLGQYSLKVSSTNIVILYLALTLTCLYQRVDERYHTNAQVIVGSLVGGGFAYLMYFLIRKNKAGNLKRKPDDNANTNPYI